MRLSLALPSYQDDAPSDWEFVIDRARLCDITGVDRVVVSDHVAFGENLEAYSRPEIGGIANGTQPTSPDGSWLEPLTVLAAVSSVTRHVRLGTNILLAALRRPVILAKTASTIDALSGGRLDLGVGVGWQREEYDAAGLEFSRRGRLLDHTLEVCQTLWGQQRASYRSPELTFDNIHMMPKPAHGIPVWCSGRVNLNVARRLARYGTGWITWDVDTADLADSIARMRELVADVGGSAEPFLVQAGLALERDVSGDVDLPRTMAVIPAMMAAGVTEVNVNRLRIPADPGAAAQTLMEFVTAFRVAAGRQPLTDLLPTPPQD
jgi:probable F420-dependent oxidoreductase